MKKALNLTNKPQRQSTLREASRASIADTNIAWTRMLTPDNRAGECYINKAGYCNWWLDEVKR